MTWPLLVNHTTDTAFFFFGRFNICDHLRNCFSGRLPTTPSSSSDQLDEDEIMDHHPQRRDKRNNKQDQPITRQPEDLGGSCEYNRVIRNPPGIGRNDNGTTSNLIDTGGHHETVKERGLTTQVPDTFHHQSSRKPEIPPTHHAPLGSQNPTLGSSGHHNQPSNSQPRGPPPPQSQNIRQHVETSLKTGVFHLSKAKLVEFPSELNKVESNLRNINLSDNRITAFPPNLEAFTNLKFLNLSSNQIDLIPDQIGQLAKLETLILTNNRIKTVPGTVAQLDRLRDANLGSNQITSFPVVFSSLKSLSVLDLSRNRIGEVPDGVGGLQVVELILSQNQIKKVSKDLALCPHMKTLRLQENKLELRGIPPEILKDSLVSLISLEGNLFDVNKLSELEGYESYMERYTSTKKKLA